MIDSLSIWSDNGYVANLACGDLAVIRVWWDPTVGIRHLRWWERSEESSISELVFICPLAHSSQEALV